MKQDFYIGTYLGIDGVFFKESGNTYIGIGKNGLARTDIRYITDLRPAYILDDQDLIITRMAIQEGLEELTKLEGRLYPHAIEVDKLRGCFYALRQKFPRVAITLILKNEIGKVCVTEPLAFGAVVEVASGNRYLRTSDLEIPWSLTSASSFPWASIQRHKPVLLSEGL